MRLTTITPLYLLTASVAAIWAAPTTEPGQVEVLDNNGYPITKVQGAQDKQNKFSRRILNIITGTGGPTIKLPANVPGNGLLVPKEFPKNEWLDEKIYFRYTGGSACPPSWPCFGWSAMMHRTSNGLLAGALLKREEDGHYSVIRATFPSVALSQDRQAAIVKETEELKQLAKKWEHAEYLYIDYNQAQP